MLHEDEGHVPHGLEGVWTVAWHGHVLERGALGLALACVAVVCLYSLATLVWHLRADQGLAEAMSINTVGGPLTGVVLGATFSGTCVVWGVLRLAVGRRSGDSGVDKGIGTSYGERTDVGADVGERGEDKCGLEGRTCGEPGGVRAIRPAETGRATQAPGPDALARALRAVGAAGMRLGPMGALVALSLAGQLALILALRTYMSAWWDSMLLVAFAKVGIDQGIPAMLASPADDLFGTAGNYLSCYPFQSGYLFLIMACMRTFGPGFAMALQVLNAIANEVGALSVVWLGREMGLGRRGTRALCVLLGLSLPFWLLCVFPYGNAIGYAFAFLVLAMNVRAMGRQDVGGRMMWVGLSLAPMAVALTFKATTALVMVAVAAAWLVRCAGRRGAWAGLASFALCLLVAGSVSGAPFAALGRASDGYPFKGPESTLSHIELGLRMGEAATMSSVNDRDLAVTPGQYSRTSVMAWFEAGGDKAAQDEAAWARIREDAAGFTSDPAGGLWFLAVKLASMWGDPSYQSLYVLGNSVGPDGKTTAAVAAALTSPVAQSVLVTLMRGVQVLTFVGALVALVDMLGCGLGRGAHAAVAVALAFAVGFGCYVLWEAKALYVLPFAVVILPLSARGIVSLLDDAGEMKRESGEGKCVLEGRA